MDVLRDVFGTFGVILQLKISFNFYVCICMCVCVYIYIYIYIYIRVKLKESRNRLGVAQRVPGGLGSQISMTFSTWRW